MKKAKISLIIFCVLCGVSCMGQTSADASEQVRLFDYPVAPDTCSTLESRCNFLITHFWDNYDISKPIKDDVAFAKAFLDYVEFFKYGHRNVVMAGIRDFMYKARGNASNLEKIGRVAEFALYSPQASFWSDEVYVEFAKSLAGATNLPKEARNYYKQQMGRINQCQVGQPLLLEYVEAATGAKRSLNDIQGEHIIVCFGGPGADTSIGITRLSTDVVLNSLIEEGTVKMVYIYVGKPDAGWDAGLPQQWICGYSPQALEHIDLRALPACYLLDKEHKIANKNVTVDALKSSL